MSTIFEVRSISQRDNKLHTWGAKNSREDAQALLEKQFGGDNTEWAEKRHKRWWIEEIDTTGQFQIPSLPAPRDRYSARVTATDPEDGYGHAISVDVLNDTGDVIAQYTRNLGALRQTFEPFRQGDRMFALISPDYTATSVMDLATGKIIASETPHTNGFCPVGFYVPDWWDINDGSMLPGSSRWKEDYENPIGNFGFVWGCHWGDDSSWKIQLLDLSDIQNGNIAREERFGYINLATDPNVHPREFISCEFYNGKCRVGLRMDNHFDLETGTLLSELD